MIVLLQSANISPPQQSVRKLWGLRLWPQKPAPFINPDRTTSGRKCHCNLTTVTAVKDVLESNGSLVYSTCGSPRGCVCLATLVNFCDKWITPCTNIPCSLSINKSKTVKQCKTNKQACHIAGHFKLKGHKINNCHLTLKSLHVICIIYTEYI